MRIIGDDHRIATYLGVAEPDLVERSRTDHIHDYATGGARKCSVCGLRRVDASIKAGGRVVGPRSDADDGYRMQTGKDGAAPHPAKPDHTERSVPRPPNHAGFSPEPPQPLELDSPNTVDRPRLTRMDVVAHGWNLLRRPGEDDDHLATRVRRAAAGVPVRPPVPPMDWVPPKGYRLGQKWTATAKRSGYDITFDDHTVTVSNGQGVLLDSMLGEPKRVN